MEIVKQGWLWVNKPVNPLELIEEAGRTCYKSEGKTSNGSARKFASMIIGRGHDSVIEHASASVRFITNRGVTHELVRHRIASFSQESTRYVRYDGKMQFIRPVWWEEWSDGEQEIWLDSMRRIEREYRELMKLGSRAEQAREILPNSLKTEIVMTANLREWQHIFKLRCQKAAHPQIRALMIDCLGGFHAEIPVIFDVLADLYL